MSPAYFRKPWRLTVVYINDRSRTNSYKTEAAARLAEYVYRFTEEGSILTTKVWRKSC